MKLTESELRHIKNVEWGVNFWRWFRWLLFLTLLITALSSYLGWADNLKIDWLIAGFVYLLVAWPGLCRTYVFHTLKRVALEDAEARQQLEEIGIKR